MKHKFKFSNGDKVEEIVTGFTGIITGAACYLTGCNTYLVVAECKDRFTEAKSIWYDEGRLNLLSKELNYDDVKAEENGCDIEAPNKG